MFTVPLFIFSKKTKSAEYLDTISITANIPSGYTWNDATVTINGSSVPNPYYIDIRNGVEIVTEKGKKYIKAKDYFLSEKFTTTTNLDTSAVDSSTGLEANYKRALWADSTTDGITGEAGRLECAYTVESYTPKSTSTRLADENSLKIPVEIESKTKNVIVTGSGYIDSSLSNSIILGNTLQDTQTISKGNSLNGTSNFTNNFIFYPFAKNPATTSNPTYGTDNNTVPAGSIVSKITFSSSSPGIYGLQGRLLLKFDLYNGSKFVQQKEVELLASPNTLFTNINATMLLNTETFFAQNVIFKNVYLKTATGLVLQDATAIMQALKLDLTATYVDPNNELVTLQPEIISPIFLLKTDSVLNPPTGLEFEGFGSLTLNNINSISGIDVYARFSTTKDGVSSEAFTYMGTVTGTGATTQTLFLLETDKAAKKSQAQSAKYVQIKLSSRLNTTLNIYEKSTLSRLFVGKQQDARRKSFTFNAFPEKLKFGQASVFESFDNNFLSPFLLKNSIKKTYSSGNYASYNLDGLKSGTILLEHIQSKTIKYAARSKLSTAEEEPFYTPTDTAVSTFNSTSVSEGKTKHLVLSYDIVTTQGGSGYYESSTSTDTRGSQLGRVFSAVTGFPSTSQTTTQVNVNNLFFPAVKKSISVTAKKSGLVNTSFPTQKYTEDFSIDQRTSYKDSCYACTGGGTNCTTTEYVGSEPCNDEQILKDCKIGCLSLLTEDLTDQGYDDPYTRYNDCLANCDAYSNQICTETCETFDEYCENYTSTSSRCVSIQDANAVPPGYYTPGGCTDCRYAGVGSCLYVDQQTGKWVPGNAVRCVCPASASEIEQCKKNNPPVCTGAKPINQTYEECYSTNCTCQSRTYFVNNTHFNFKFENFREEVIEYTPGTKPITKVLWSQPYDIENFTGSDLIIGNWIAEQKSSSISYSLEPLVYAAELDLPVVPERFTIPSINFDKFAVINSNVAHTIKVSVLAEFLNENNQILGSSGVKTFNNSVPYETIIETPSGVGTAKKLKFYIGIEPAINLQNNTAISEIVLNNTVVENAEILAKLNIPQKLYSLTDKDQLNDVGVDFSGKPRLEYLDTSINSAQRKLYQQSQAVSLAYDLFTIAGISSYSISGTQYPVIKSAVFFDGVTSIPEGTSVTVEWQGKNAVGDAWGAWKSDPLNYNSSGELALDKRYVRFRVTLVPEKTELLYKGYKSPILDEIKIKFWPYNVPYVEKYSLNMSDAGDKAVLTEIKSPNKDLLTTSITTNGTWPNPVYTTLTPVTPTTVTSPNNNAKVKVTFATDEAKLDQVTVDVFGSDSTGITTTTTTTTTTTSTTTTTTTI